MNSKDFDSESQQIREVFATYGLAMYQAQCLEKQLVVVLSGPYSPTPDKLTRGRIDDLMDTNLEQTFGALAKEVKSRTTLPTDTDEKLDRAVEDRNWLAHHYWWDRASEFNTFSGRKKMLTELTELAAFFDELDGFFVKVALDWGTRIGLTEENLNVEMAKLLSGPTPPRKKIRKLNKVEILINAYSYIVMEKGLEKKMPLFEFADHTFWTFCDCGLTYGPEEIDSTCLHPVPAFKKALPAEIRPKPKDAKDWNYRIPLSTGFHIRVSPYEGEGEYEFKWGLFKSK